jgi:hypothetical protein
MDRWIRWVVAILVVAAIIGLITFARGTPEHGGAQAASARAGAVTLTV